MTPGDRIYLLHPHPFPGRWATVIVTGPVLRVRLDNGCPARVTSRHQYRTEAEENARLLKEEQEQRELLEALEPADLRFCVEKAAPRLNEWQRLLMQECLRRYEAGLP